MWKKAAEALLGVIAIIVLFVLVDKLAPIIFRATDPLVGTWSQRGGSEILRFGTDGWYVRSRAKGGFEVGKWLPDQSSAINGTKTIDLTEVEIEQVKGKWKIKRPQPILPTRTYGYEIWTSRLESGEEHLVMTLYGRDSKTKPIEYRRWK